MSASAPSVPPQLWLRSPRALAELEATDLRDWLRHGVSAWSSVSRSHMRMEAFAPILLNPREPGPRHLAGALSDVVSETGRGDFRWRLETALAQEIAVWTYTDGLESGEFLLELAGWYGCRNVERALRSLMARPIHLGARARLDLSAAIGFVLCRRTEPETALSLARRMATCGLGSQPVMAQTVAFAAAAAPIQLPALLDEFLPGWQEGGYWNDASRQLADQLVDRVGLAELAFLILSGDPRTDDLSVLLQNHRIRLGERVNDRIEVRDELGDMLYLPARGLDLARARGLVGKSAEQQFREQSVGELVPDDELIDIAKLAA